jgi:class 3 adenylate cyclase
METLSVYIPMDRRQAMARGESLPDRSEGAALMADVSGFTPLTEALARELGPQHGVEEITRYLNQVYDALIAEVDRYHGSVIGFSGDAITCWFDGDDGLRATTCAVQLQRAMEQFSRIRLPSGPAVSLAVKAAVAIGPVRRFVVGDPNVQLLDVLAGATLDRLAAEHQARKAVVSRLKPPIG